MLWLIESAKHLNSVFRYKPVQIELDTKLRAFIPDFIPAVGEVDAFLKMPRPDNQSEQLGLSVLVNY